MEWNKKSEALITSAFHCLGNIRSNLQQLVLPSVTWRILLFQSFNSQWKSSFSNRPMFVCYITAWCYVYGFSNIFTVCSIFLTVHSPGSFQKTMAYVFLKIIDLLMHRLQTMCNWGQHKLMYTWMLTIKKGPSVSDLSIPSLHLPPVRDQSDTFRKCTSQA